MYTLKELYLAESLDAAYHVLLRSKRNVLLGGGTWLRLGHKNYQTAVDLSALNLDFIRESDEYIEIGAMCTLRQLETSALLKHYCNGVLADSVKHIVGVQFRNLATVGGSVFGRFGFSDLSTTLLALNAEVKLYHAGIVPLIEFMAMPRTKDILEMIIIKKENYHACYQTIRNTQTDFPVLTVVLAQSKDYCQVAVGARPQKAVLCPQTAKLLMLGQCEQACQCVMQEIHFGTNLRADCRYRQAMAGVLLKRCVQEAEQCK